MIQTLRMWTTLALAVGLATITPAPAAQSPSPGIGIVIMHGKGGSSTKYVSDLASSLEEKGYLVANLEMPWSGRREYDVNVDAATKEVQSALDTLRSRGAKKLFVVGHSLGALFALYYAGKHLVDGVIAIAPGGSVSTPIYREKLGESVELARSLVTEGKANEKTRFTDYEGARGTYPVTTTPVAYLSWFDPDGAMSLIRVVKAMNPKIPVLYVAPKGDYPILLKAKQLIFSSLPAHPLTKLYEPDSTHLDAPSTSRDEILRWTTEVVNRAN
ncbi:MAG: alpha/beta fold hydrolase [Nitrospirota bacterium]